MNDMSSSKSTTASVLSMPERLAAAISSFPVYITSFHSPCASRRGSTADRSICKTSFPKTPKNTLTASIFACAEARQ